MLGLHCCVGSSLVVVRGGYSLAVLCRLPTAAASLTAEHGLWGTQSSEVAAYGLQTTSSVVVTQGLSCPAACGIFSDHRSNWHPLRCKADSWNTREAWTTREAFLQKLLNLIFAFMYTLPFFLKVLIFIILYLVILAFLVQLHINRLYRKKLSNLGR